MKKMLVKKKSIRSPTSDAIYYNNLYMNIEINNHVEKLKNNPPLKLQGGV